MPAAKKKKDQGIKIEKLELEMINLQIVGIRPLIVHAWDPKTQIEMISKQMKLPVQGSKLTERDPYAEVEAALYRIPEIDGGGYGVPAAAFKQSFVDACRYTSLTMVSAQGAFHVRGIEVEIPPIVITTKGGEKIDLGEKSMELVPIYGSEPTRRMDMVRLDGGGKADVRFRPQFKKWFCYVPVQIAKGAMTAQQVADLANRAGFHCGICEWRPMSKKSKNGSYGMYRVAMSKEEQKLFKGIKPPVVMV
jgi:hypothetical protein